MFAVCNNSRVGIAVRYIFTAIIHQDIYERVRMIFHYRVLGSFSIVNHALVSSFFSPFDKAKYTTLHTSSCICCSDDKGATITCGLTVLWSRTAFNWKLVFPLFAPDPKSWNGAPSTLTAILPRGSNRDLIPHMASRSTLTSEQRARICIYAVGNFARFTSSYVLMASTWNLLDLSKLFFSATGERAHARPPSLCSKTRTWPAMLLRRRD